MTGVARGLIWPNVIVVSLGGMGFGVGVCLFWNSNGEDIVDHFATTSYIPSYGSCFNCHFTIFLNFEQVHPMLSSACLPDVNLPARFGFPSDVI